MGLFIGNWELKNTNIVGINGVCIYEAWDDDKLIAVGSFLAIELLYITQGHQKPKREKSFKLFGYEITVSKIT